VSFMERRLCSYECTGQQIDIVVIVTYQGVFKRKSDIQNIVVSFMKQRVKLFKSALCSKVTIVVFVAVQDVETSYKYTELKHASFKLQNSTHLIRISQHFRLLPCPALASEGCCFMWKLCTGVK